MSVTPSSSALSGTYTVSGQVVTVTYDKPCKVGYLSGGKYVAAPAVASGSGYAFTLPDGITEAILVVKGDVNGDGKIKAGDASLIQKYVVHKITLTNEAFFAADVTGDGKVKAGDATNILKYVVHKASTLDDIS